jgi:hypothetical protein
VAGRLGQGRWVVVGRRKIEKKRGGARLAEKTVQQAWREKKVLFYFKPIYKL